MSLSLMRFFLKIYILFSLLCVCFFAYGRATPCPGEFGISAEWLYVLAAIEDPEFVILEETNSSIIPNDQTWHSGYRIDLIYNFCHCPIDFLFRWTHFPTFCDSRKVNGTVRDLIQQSDGDSSSIKEAFNVHYVDFLLGWSPVSDCPILITFQGGVQYARIRFLETSTLINQGQSSEFRNKSRLLWGAGPEIGADFSFNLWRCLGLTARSYGSLLINKRIARLDRATATTSNKNYVGIVPFLNGRIGVIYSRLIDLQSLRSFNLDIEMGYETSWFFNSVARIQPNASTASEIVKWMTFAIHGPYVQVGIAF